MTTVDVSGASTGTGGPTAQPGPAVPGYGLLGAIVEGPQGLIFFKFLGPAKIVAANQAACDKMLDSLGPAGVASRAGHCAPGAASASDCAVSAYTPLDRSAVFVRRNA